MTDAPAPDPRSPESPDAGERPIGSFRGAHPTHDLHDWHWLWGSDRSFPLESHRQGLLGRLLVSAKRLLRPLVKAPQADLWDRQRVFNQVLIEILLGEQARLDEVERRLGHLERFVPEALDDLLGHNDALFSRVDQKLDRARRETTELSARLGAALALSEERRTEEGRAAADAGAEDGDRRHEALERLRDESAYLALEARYRGTEEEIRERIEQHLPRLEPVRDLGARLDVVDLGCGRGEALRVFRDAGFSARGVDASAEMVARARERGLDAVEGDLFAYLTAVEESSVGAVVSFHVIEHVPATELERLLRLAHRALAPGGLLLLETPSPLSLLVSGRSFWLDPTHLRPVHPDSLALFAREAGFDPVERIDLRPYPPAERLPEISLDELGEPATLPDGVRRLADRVNRLRDRLDDVLYGYQDYALLAEKPGCPKPPRRAAVTAVDAPVESAPATSETPDDDLPWWRGGKA